MQSVQLHNQQRPCCFRLGRATASCRGSRKPVQCSSSNAPEASSQPEQPKRRGRPRKNLAELFQQQPEAVDPAILPSRRVRPKQQRTTGVDGLPTPEDNAQAAAQVVAKALAAEAWSRYRGAFLDLSKRPAGTLQKVSLPASASQRASTGASSDTSDAEPEAGPRGKSRSTPSSLQQTAALVQRRLKSREQQKRISSASAAAAAAGKVLYVPIRPEQRAPYKAALQEAVQQQATEIKAQQYEARLEQLLKWRDPASVSRTGVPAHLPVIDQATWVRPAAARQQPSPVQTAPSSSSTTAGRPQQEEEGLDNHPKQQQSRREADQEALAAVSMAMQQVLGTSIPERGLRSVRGSLLSTLSPLAVTARLRAWVGVCGRDFVAQVMEKQPTLMGHEPSCLLTTLDALNSRLGLAPGDCVSLVARHPVLVGLTGEELEKRVTEVAEALGVSNQEAAQLGVKQPGLLMITPAVLAARSQALLELLMLPQQELMAVLRLRPEALIRGPAALAGRIQRLAAALGVRVYAAGKIVRAEPAIVEKDPERLAERFKRLVELATCCQAWALQMKQLSPAGMGRCLLCSDARLERLSELARLGLAGGLDLPPFKKILTMPDVWYQRLRDSCSARVQRKRQQRAAEAAAAAEGGSSADGSISNSQSSSSSGAAAAPVSRVSRANGKPAMDRTQQQAAVDSGHSRASGSRLAHSSGGSSQLRPQPRVPVVSAGIADVGLQVPDAWGAGVDQLLVQ